MNSSNTMALNRNASIRFMRGGLPAAGRPSVICRSFSAANRRYELHTLIFQFAYSALRTSPMPEKLPKVGLAIAY